MVAPLEITSTTWITKKISNKNPHHHANGGGDNFETICITETEKHRQITINLQW